MLLRRSTPAGTGRPSLLARLLGTAGRDASFDALESRQLLTHSPLPTLAMLESASNTVIRLETNYGDIDIELFNSAAPITVGNFLNYTTSGRHDGTFFHRSAFSNGDPFVLQGGGFYFDDVTGVTAVSTDPPIIREATGRSNVARTVAMARQQAANTATGQFFINYVDNLFLDGTGSQGNEGYAVFGRVIQGWDVVLAIQNLRSLDLAESPASPPFDSGVGAGIGGEVPVGNAYFQGDRVTENDVVMLLNSEVIKPASMNGFFSQRLAMPEGYRSASNTETLELKNPNGVAASYQVIARYENGMRDAVLSQGTILANTTKHIDLHSSDTELNTVRTNTPYALIVETALPENQANPQPIAASVNRSDFNASTGEGFFNPAGWTDAQLRDWLFPRVERSTTSREFITWVNLTENTATITVDFLTSGGTVSVVRTTEGYRRGGLDASALGLNLGTMSVRVRSTQNIVAFMSDWDFPIAGVAPAPAVFTPAFGVMGEPGGGASSGGLAGAVIRNNHTNTLSIYNPGNTAAVVSLRFWRTGRDSGDSPNPDTVIVFAGGRNDYALTAGGTGVPVDEVFTVTYTSGSAKIAVQFTSVDNILRGQLLSSGRNDGVATLFTTMLAPEVHFTDGSVDPNRSDPSTQVERISLFSPFQNPGVNYTYTVRYSFSDGSQIDAFTGALTTNARIDLFTRDNNAVMTKVGSAQEFRHYTITITGGAVSGSDNIFVAPLAQLTRTDTGQGQSITTGGSRSGLGFAWNDAVFAP